ncbi:hypothetical protein BMW22_39195 (plasmid) [Rhizobium leguminosarum]|uniref:Uncharacterized protein n=1 Tax=Rhizobium leguminosarum TaxID=384 RepID=A0A1L3ZPD2_RHILE|nr:hypothetical protein BMW22_39195 [Rhizobium leguminosarum]
MRPSAIASIWFGRSLQERAHAFSIWALGWKSPLQKPPRGVIVSAFKPEVDLVCRASIAAGNALLP